jgi:two-component system, cell cycle sensor histidine kinase and response regulator CckA
MRDLYFSLFEDAPVAIWYEDFSRIRQFLDEIQAAGVTDIREYLAVTPEAVRECLQRLTVHTVNRRAREFYEAETSEELLHALPDLFDEKSIEIFRNEVAAFAQGAKHFEAELSTRTLKGEVRSVQMNVSMLDTPAAPWSRVIVAFTDLTQQRRLEEELFQARQLDSLGRLAGGVAHDLNNLLTIINGYTDMLLGDATRDPSMRASLDEIRRAGERAAQLTQQLLAFSRRQALQPKVIDLTRLIGDSESMVRRMIGDQIELSTDLGRSLGRVRADPAQLHHVLINLVLNARDAMPAGGRLSIWTSNVELDAAEAEELRLTSGSYVLLGIGDNGVGMDEQTMARVFEPFFTTKRRGNATGLGASTAFGIVKQSGGSIGVSSQPGQGSCFEIYLPQVEAPPDPHGDRPKAGDGRGSEIILVVDDEEHVRRLLCSSLGRYGYRVLEAASGAEALTLFEQHHSSIHLVVTDVVMSGLTGPQMATHLMERVPDLRVVYISGYADAPNLKELASRPNARFLQKPFLPHTLALTVRELLAH